ncbi:MAG: nucleotidyl transferase AbiEii/AbiGii toxin family protein [Campylobacteraceae bacterium]|jgi:predicted nucleotidyltransferase component of viral defense system|nr:nucleotidyl transferase AbiEii/AbiGii toxin family protein [Campylobacteraceae bacterium]
MSENIEELHQRVMKSCILNIQKDKPLILKGGTALMLGYGLDRFSEDLDFDIAQSFKGENSIKLDSVLKNSMPADIELTSLNVKKNINAVTRYMLNYKDKQSGLTGTLKIEVSYGTPVLENNIHT